VQEQCTLQEQASKSNQGASLEMPHWPFRRPSADPKTDAAVAATRELHHALRFIEISLGDPELAPGIRIYHSAKYLLDKPGM
jgi:hypothetical protein